MAEYNRQHNPFLDSLELSVRADRLLRAWGRVQSAHDFLNLKRSEFMALKGAGVKTWNEIVHLQRMFLREETRVVPAEPAPQQIMSLRDAAALAALQGFCSQSDSSGMWSWLPDIAAAEAWRVADAFIAARETKP